MADHRDNGSTQRRSDQPEIAAFRSALQEILATSGLTAEVRVTLMLSEVGRLIACTAGDDFESMVDNVQVAVEHAARTARLAGGPSSGAPGVGRHLN